MMPSAVEKALKDSTAMHRQKYYVSLTVHGRFGPNHYSKMGVEFGLFRVRFRVSIRVSRAPIVMAMQRSQPHIPILE